MELLLHLSHEKQWLRPKINHTQWVEIVFTNQNMKGGFNKDSFVKAACQCRESNCDFPAYVLSFAATSFFFKDGPFPVSFSIYFRLFLAQYKSVQLEKFSSLQELNSGLRSRNPEC